VTSRASQSAQTRSRLQSGNIVILSARATARFICQPNSESFDKTLSNVQDAAKVLVQ